MNKKIYFNVICDKLPTVLHSNHENWFMYYCIARDISYWHDSIKKHKYVYLEEINWILHNRFMASPELLSIIWSHCDDKIDLKRQLPSYFNNPGKYRQRRIYRVIKECYKRNYIGITFKVKPKIEVMQDIIDISEVKSLKSVRYRKGAADEMINNSTHESRLIKSPEEKHLERVSLLRRERDLSNNYESKVKTGGRILASIKSLKDKITGKRI